MIRYEGWPLKQASLEVLLTFLLHPLHFPLFDSIQFYLLQTNELFIHFKLSLGIRYSLSAFFNRLNVPLFLTHPFFYFVVPL